MAATPEPEELSLSLPAAPEHLASVRAFVGEAWLGLGFDDEATDDARVVASEALAELLAKRGSGLATISIAVDVRTVSATIRLRPDADAPAVHVTDDDRRASLIVALMPAVRMQVDATPASITFEVPRPA